MCIVWERSLDGETVQVTYDISVVDEGNLGWQTEEIGNGLADGLSGKGTVQETNSWVANEGIEW